MYSGIAFHNAPVKGLSVSPLQSPQALNFINHSSKFTAGRSKKQRMSRFWREYYWNRSLHSLSGHSLAAVNESWKGEKERGRKKRNLASSSCFFQWIKMPSFHKQDDLAVLLDSDSGQARSSYSWYLGSSALLRLTLGIWECLLWSVCLALDNLHCESAGSVGPRAETLRV